MFYCCRAAIPHLRRRGGGWIINISSLAGKNPFVGGAAYCASKAGLNAFSEALMQEVRYDNIRVSCIMPGSVATGFSGRGDGRRRRTGRSRPDDVAGLVARSGDVPGAQPAEPHRAQAVAAEEVLRQSTTRCRRSPTTTSSSGSASARSATCFARAISKVGRTVALMSRRRS